MPEHLQAYFEMPTLPFTVLVCVTTAYWLLMILGAVDLDFLDFDLDTEVNVDADTSIFDWGLVGLRWFNLGDVPLMVWMSIFSIVTWCMSLWFDQDMSSATSQDMMTAMLRNIGVGLLATKGITQPLKGKLRVVEPNTVADLIGRTGVVVTEEATESFGQVQCKAEGAPLLLNVKTIDGDHPKGTIVEIVDYKPDERVYVVRTANEPLTVS